MKRRTLLAAPLLAILPQLPFATPNLTLAAKQPLFPILRQPADERWDEYRPRDSPQYGVINRHILQHGDPFGPNKGRLTYTYEMTAAHPYVAPVADQWVGWTLKGRYVTLPSGEQWKGWIAHHVNHGEYGCAMAWSSNWLDEEDRVDVVISESFKNFIEAGPEAAHALPVWEEGMVGVACRLN